MGALFLRAIQEYDHGSVEQLSHGSPITYCGVEISQSSERIVSVSQADFYPNLTPLDSHAILKDGRFAINVAKRRKLVKSFVGGCLRMVQRRYDICFTACQLASDVIDAIRRPEKMKKFIAGSRRVFSRISKHHQDICFRNFLNASAPCPYPE